MWFGVFIIISVRGGLILCLDSKHLTCPSQRAFINMEAGISHVLEKYFFLYGISINIQMTDLFNIMPKGRTGFFCFDSLQMGWFQPSVYIVTTLLKETRMHKCALRTDHRSSSHHKNDLVRSPGLQSHSGQLKADRFLFLIPFKRGPSL